MTRAQQGSNSQQCTVMIQVLWQKGLGKQGRLKEQSDQGPDCLPLRPHRLDSLLYGKTTELKFIINNFSNFFRHLTVSDFYGSYVQTKMSSDMTKPTKWVCTQWRLRSAWASAWVLSYPLSAQRRLWSDWADAQTDLSLRWANNHFVGFVMSWLKCLPDQCPC